MSDRTPDRVLLGIGSTLQSPQGELVVTGRSRGWIFAMDQAGVQVEPIPAKAAARMMMTSDNPPPFNPRSHGLRERLTEKAVLKLAKEDGYIHLLLTGRTAEKLPPDVCWNDLDPDLVPDIDVRLRAVIRVYAWREGVQLDSARKGMSRILNRKPGGLERRVHQRYLRPTRSRLDPRYPLIIQAWVSKNKYQSNRGIRALYYLFLTHMAHEYPDVKLLSEETFGRHLRELWARDWTEQKRASTRGSAKRVPPPVQERKRASTPGRIWSGDSTIGNVQLWDPRAASEKRVLYRPVVTIFVSDRGMIVGRAVTKTGDTFAVMLAFADALARMVDHNDFVEVDGQRYAVPLQPAPDALQLVPLFPESIVTDNGMNYVSDAFVAQVEAMNIDFDPTRAATPTDKAGVESTLGSLRKMFDELQAGYVGFGVDQRGIGVDDDTVLTFYDYVDRLDEWIAIFNYSHVNRGLRHPEYPGRTFTPFEFTMLTSQEQGADEVFRWENQWVRFLPSVTAKITKNGVAFGDELYTAPILNYLVESADRAAAGRWVFYRNPSDLRRIYTFTPDGTVYEVPWIHLTAETPPFGEHAAVVAKESLGAKHHTKRDYNLRLHELLVVWTAEDERRKHLLRTDRESLQEEMQEYALDKIRRTDPGTIVAAPLPTRTTEEVPSIGTAVEMAPVRRRQPPRRGAGPAGGDDADLFEEFE